MSHKILSNAITYHQAGALPQAEQLYRQQLEHDPDSEAALDGLGVLLLQMNRAQEAIPLIDAAIKLNPGEHLYHYHLAEAHIAAGNIKLAITAYQQAIRYHSTVADYHFALGNALTESGETIDAIKAFKASLLIDPDDIEALNNLANNLADTGQLKQAGHALEQALLIDPNYATAHLNLARVLFESSDREAAVLACKKAIKLQPGLFEAHLELGRWQYQNSKTLQQALHSFAVALQLRPTAIEAKRGLANTLLKLDQPETALALYREILKSESDTQTYLGISHCQIQLQAFSEAELMAEKAIALNPEFGEAYLSLGICLQTRGDFGAAKIAHAKALQLNPDLTDAAYHLAILDREAASSPGFRCCIQRLERQQLTPKKQSHLYFALGKLADREARYDAAFEYFQQANAIKATLYPFDESRYKEYIQRIMTTFTPSFFSERSGFGKQGVSPVFIVGMPRSGSTLVEQILNAHSQIQGVGEHRAMREIMQQIPKLTSSQQANPECISNISAQQSRELGQIYLDSLATISQGTEQIADKMLGNFLRLGLIALLFPEARVIHCQREPLDTGLSCYTQDFSTGLRFTTDLRHIGIAYTGYMALMAHWEQVLPLRTLCVNYENMVSHTEKCTRELIEFCDLPWDDACLQHHKAKSNIATASFLQVRQPVYRNAIGKWKRYEQQLAPLMDALEKGSVSFQR